MSHVSTLVCGSEVGAGLHVPGEGHTSGEADVAPGPLLSILCPLQSSAKVQLRTHVFTVRLHRERAGLQSMCLRYPARPAVTVICISPPCLYLRHQLCEGKKGVHLSCFSFVSNLPTASMSPRTSLATTAFLLLCLFPANCTLRKETI